MKNIDPEEFKNKEIEIAPQIESESYQNIADDFFPRILDMDSCDVLWTDESSMFDFFWMDEWEQELQKALDKIEKFYKLVYTTDDDLKLVDIFKAIENLT